MADNQSRRADPAFLENDPFAELTRIMGHDPRAAEPAPSEDDFDIDLEKELMGELDFDEFDAPQDQHAEAPEGRIEGQGDFLPDHAAADKEDGFGDENVALPAADDDVSVLDDPFSDEIEPFDDPQVFESVSEPTSFADVEAAELHRQEIEADDRPTQAESQSWEPQDDHHAVGEVDVHAIDEADFASAMEQELAGDEPAYAPVLETVHEADEQPAYDWRVDAAPPAGQAEDGVNEADFDMDFGFIDDDIAREVEAAPTADEVASEPPVAELAADEEPFDHEDVAEPAAASDTVSPFAPAASLEDELSALLEADAPAPAGSRADVPASGEEWHPGVNTFGHADAAAFGPDEDEAAETSQDDVRAEAPEDHLAAEASHEDEPAEPVQAEADHGFAAPEPAAAPVSMLGDEDFADIFRDEDIASGDQPAQEDVAVRPVAAAAVVAAPFVMRPVTTPSAPEPAHMPPVDALASWRPQRAPVEAAPPPAAAPTAYEPPEVETIELTEGPQPVAEDLDIPEVDYGRSQASTGPYGDLESEIAQAFGDLSIEETDHSVQPTAPAAATAGWSTAPAAYAVAQAEPQYAADASDPAQDETVDAYAVGEGQWQSDAAYPDDGFDYDTEVEQAMAMSAFEDEPQQDAAPARKRGVLVAAVVAGVAVVGGAGLFAMSLFGGGSDEPAVVLADSDPVKVRPENPGGTEVPNQDNQVYQRVSQGPAEVDPEQERLITTAEEPVDVTAAAETPPPALAPGVSDEPAGAAPATGDDTPAQPADTPAQVAGSAAPESSGETTASAPQPKSEERITAEATAPATTASEEVALVKPRRVRTMIVRPDGTMVPREEPVPAPQETASVLSQPSVVDAPTLAPVGELAPAPGSETAAGEEGPVVDTPETVAVVPSQRTQPAASADPAPQQQAPEATPVSAPAAAAPAAAATSEWSMQIASQPTAEGAQATYQDLARRYGSVLQGRGVNIVRADIQGMGVYYRVRIPAASRDEAIQLCTEYKSAGGSCFVSR